MNEIDAEKEHKTAAKKASLPSQLNLESLEQQCEDEDGSRLNGNSREQTLWNRDFESTTQIQQFRKNQAKITCRDKSSKMKEDDHLHNDLLRLMIGDEHLLKIKAQYLDERTALNLRNPVNFAELEQYFQNKYRRLLNFYYTTPSHELMIQVRNQQEFDHVIKLHEGTNKNSRRMRLILSQKRDQPSEHQNNSTHQQTHPPMGVHHNPHDITETPLSDSSSLWSLISGRSAPLHSPNRMERCPEDEQQALGTPRAPVNWREGRCLGRGAFGQVFVCLNIDNGEQLVVKKVHLSTANTRHRQRVLATLENELNALGSLQHPHIVRYLGIVQRQDSVNIFMELMAGGSLKDQINEYGAMGEAIAIKFTGQILSGLAYLHTRDIVHRDIKPANILRHTQAHIKIADFGAAKFLQEICSDQGVDIEGTPHYTAPEIIRGDSNRRFEPRSDIWSVGITVFEMLTTMTPWAGIDPAAVHLRIAFHKPDLSCLPQISPEFRKTIESMLASDLQQRPQATHLLNMHPFNDEK